MAFQPERLYPLDVTVIEAAKAKQEFEAEVNRMLYEFREKTGLEITSIDLIDCRTYGGAGGFMARACVEML